MLSIQAKEREGEKAAPGDSFCIHFYDTIWCDMMFYNNTVQG